MNQLQFPQPFHHDRTRNASAQVFEYLRENIINLNLKPATQLPRPALSEYFGLSQTPIRDALLRLVEEGLVDIYPQHMTVVRGIDVKSAQRAQFLRQSIEVEVVRTLSKAPTPDIISSLNAMLSQQADALKYGDFDRFALTDQTFHRLMYQAADVEPLWDVVRRLSGNLDRLRHLHLPMSGKAANVISQHKRILEAITQGDVVAAETAVRVHLSGTLSNLDEIRSRHASYLLENSR